MAARAEPPPWIQFCLAAHLRQATTLLRRLEEAESFWPQVEELATQKRLPARVAGALVFASHGHRLRRGIYRALVEEDITEATATCDLGRLVGAGLLEPVGEKRARRYLGTYQPRTMRAPRPSRPAAATGPVHRGARRLWRLTAYARVRLLPLQHNQAPARRSLAGCNAGSGCGDGRVDDHLRVGATHRCERRVLLGPELVRAASRTLRSTQSLGEAKGVPGVPERREMDLTGATLSGAKPEGGERRTGADVAVLGHKPRYLGAMLNLG